MSGTFTITNSTVVPGARIEDEGGPTFFVRDAEASIISGQRLAELDRRVSELRVIQYPELPHGRLDTPPRLRRKELESMPKVDGCDAAAAGMVVAAALALRDAAFSAVVVRCRGADVRLRRLPDV